jgi:multiple sugar transport system permease protein
MKALPRRVGAVLALALFVVWTLGPLTWMLISSLVPQSALLGDVRDLSFSDVTLDNYAPVLASPSLVKSLINSVVVAGLTTALAIALGAPAAYALARLPVRGADRISLVILGAQMFPPIVVVIPLFVVASQLHLLDTTGLLIVVYLSFNVPVVIWILKGFFAGLPAGLEKAAAMDGATIFQLLRYVIAPLSAGPIVASALFAFINSWNEFFLAFLLTQRNATTLPILLSAFSGQYNTDVGQLMAALVIVLSPIVLVTILFNKYILQGLVEGSTKG